MNWDRMEGAWKQRRGKAVNHWGKMMNDELATIAGKYEELVGRLQEKFGVAIEQSKHQDDDFKRVVGQLRRSNARLMALQARYKNVKPAPQKSKSKASSRKASRSQVHG